MSAYHRNYGYEEDPDDPGSWNRTRGHWTTQAYPGSQGTWNNPNALSTRNNPYSAGSRPNPDYARSRTDHPGTRYNSYTAESNYPGTFEEPDYPGSQRDPYYHGSADYQSSRNYVSSRTNPGYLGSLEKPDYPGAQGNSSNHPGSRRNPGYAASNRQPSLSSLGEPDYQIKNQPKSQDFWGEPDYPGAEEYRKAPVLWDESDYPGADGYDFGLSETQNLPRRTSSIQPSFHHGGASSLGFLSRDNEDNPESIELRSKKMMTPHDYSGTRDHGTGYVNHAYDDEVNLDQAYGNPPLYGYDWDKSPQGPWKPNPMEEMSRRSRVMLTDDQMDEIVVEVERVASGHHLSTHQLIPRKQSFKSHFSTITFKSDMDEASSWIFSDLNDVKGRQLL